MASSVNPLGTQGTGATDSTQQAAPGSSIANQGVFLQLLVSQLKNQDPLNPSDSTAFVTQLAQFSQLEQVIGIRTDTDTLAANSTPVQSTTDQGTNKTSN